jgi:RNA polymerase sigma-70 factor (ECF subfamily)
MRPAGIKAGRWGRRSRGHGLEDGIDQWFAREILPLEPALERYLRRSWRDKWEIPDLRQDAYVRVYEAALREKPFNPKHFLFQVARNLMIDRSRRKNVVSFDSFADFDGMEVDDDQPDAEQSAAARQEIRLLMSAIGELPARCREVVTLRKIDGLSQRDVARKMGITEDTVERQVANGVRLLRKLLHQNHTPEMPVAGILRGRLKVFSK